MVLALTPHLAAWGKLMIDNALGAAGTSAAAVGIDKLAQVGVLYHGLAIMGGGAILGGLVLGAIGAFVIDGAMRKAAAFALAGAVLTFFGFMHGEAIGFAQTPLVALELSGGCRRAAGVREGGSGFTSCGAGGAWSSGPRRRGLAPACSAAPGSRHGRRRRRRDQAPGSLATSTQRFAACDARHASMKAIVCAPSSMRG